MGSSLLDVGCAEGGFCFEAERLGFTDVVGIELKRDRYLAASVMRDLYGSCCVFRLRDVHELGEKERYDTVLLLNVLHHLRNPIEVLENLGKVSNRRLIIEYPTIEDPKFNATIEGERPQLLSMPFIGVSLLKDQDQTFVFTDLAIKRVLIDNLSLFRQIEFFKSPRAPGRSIAVCTK